MDRSPAIAQPVSVTPARAIFAAFCASVVGHGLGRFAYTPLIPAQIAADWFSPSLTIYFAAANLGGYLIGALSAAFFARRFGAVPLLRIMMVVATLAFFACAMPINATWFFVWRLIAGVAGGFLMVLAAPAVLPHVPAARRGIAAGVIYLGVGLGIAASGTLVPLLLRVGVAETWFGLGVMASILTAFSWAWWPGDAQLDEEAPPSPSQPDSAGLRALYVVYGLTAVGQVTHVIFLVDFIARGLNQGIEIGAVYWLAFGLGATAGPICFGLVADRLGFSWTLRLSLLLQAIALILPTLSTAPPSLLISSIVVGAFIPGSVALTIGRARELSPPGRRAHARAWGRCTASFAVGQAIGAFSYSYIFELSEDYLAIYTIGSAAVALALMVDAVAAALGHRQRSNQRGAS